jgi:DNA-binding response OmpR family regulator
MKTKNQPCHSSLISRSRKEGERCDLPLPKERAGGRGNRAQALPSAQSRAIRTFLAEESPAMMALLTRALQQDDRVAIVGSGMSGPKTFPAASSLTPDLVVMDEHFAGVDCTEVTRCLKQLPNPPTVFIVTSGDRAESQSRSLVAGADAVLINAPNLPRQLQAAVKTFFADAGAPEPQPR